MPDTVVKSSARIDLSVSRDVGLRFCRWRLTRPPGSSACIAFHPSRLTNKHGEVELWSQYQIDTRGKNEKVRSGIRFQSICLRLDVVISVGLSTPENRIKYKRQNATFMEGLGPTIYSGNKKLACGGSMISWILHATDHSFGPSNTKTHIWQRFSSELGTKVLQKAELRALPL